MQPYVLVAGRVVAGTAEVWVLWRYFKSMVAADFVAWKQAQKSIG